MLDLLRKKYIKIICAFLVLFIVLLVVVSERRTYVEKAQTMAYKIQTITANQIEKVVDDSTKNLMIVAHPDDELLWGGGHLMSKDYLVVCVTGANNSTRSEEFKKVIETSGNKYIMLGYPDKVGGRRDNWTNIRAKMMSDLESIIEYKKWDLIVTHNQNGEYGHIQHQSVHSFVTEIFDRDNVDSKLFVFGKYYTAKKIGKAKSKLTEISPEEYEFKKKLAEIYSSQSTTVTNLWHMAKYEMWTEYEQFSEHPQYKYKKKQDTNINIGVTTDEA